MDAWMAELEHGSHDRAWDLLLDRHRRLIIAAIRHYVQDYDDVMDVFALVCEALRANDYHRLRQYTAQPAHDAQFGTWLVTVVHHLTVDWFRQRDGRRRVAALARDLPSLQRRIFALVFEQGRSHAEAYELLRARDDLPLSFGAFLVEVTATYRHVRAHRRGALLGMLGVVPHPEPEQAAEPDDVATDNDRRQRLAALLAGLTPEDRLTVELYVVDDMPAQEVARIVGLANPKAVYNRVYRVLALLRERLVQAGVARHDL